MSTDKSYSSKWLRRGKKSIGLEGTAENTMNKR
jgi:hypothetical protein